MDIQNFITEFKKTFIYDMLRETLEDEQLFEHTIVGNQVIWMKEQTRQMWSMWQAAKANAVPDGYVVVPKELPETIAEAMALERVPKPFGETDPVWIEISERSYRDSLLRKKWDLWRDYKAMIQAAQEPAND